MKTTKTLTAVALTFLVATAPAALAKNGKGKQKVKKDTSLQQTFAQFDTNRDGLVSRAEFPGDSYQFALVDSNRDGMITGAEAQQAMANSSALLQDEYRRLDTDRNGVISRTEWRGDRATFDRLDRNRDGVLSNADRNGAAPVTSRFRGLDSNRDGVISRTEWRGNTTSFRQQDRNRDGVISGTELK